MTYLFFILKSPGSKCWFVPHAERFIQGRSVRTIVEPFAGSAVVGLTLLDHGHAKRLVLAERDPELHQFWKTALNDGDFAGRVSDWTRKLWGVAVEDRYQFALESVERMRQTDPALSVLLCSRLSFNGIQRSGSMVATNPSQRNWWPVSLGTSLKVLYDLRGKIELFSDGIEALKSNDRHDSYAFVDAPYSVGRLSPGHNLYRAIDVDHEELIGLLADWTGSWQMTSEFGPEVLRLLRGVIFRPRIQRYVVPMRTVNNRQKVELVLSKRCRLSADNDSGVTIGAEQQLR